MSEFRNITLLNPHADDFIKTPLSFWLVRRRGLGKYAYLIDEPVQRGEQVDVLIDGTLSSVVNPKWFALLPRWLRRITLKVEIAFWLGINGLRNKVRVHWSPDSIADRSVLYLFSYKNCVEPFPERQAIVERFTHKIVNLSHYFIRTSEKAKNIASLSNVTLTSESDLRLNIYFRKFFPADRAMLVLPFAVSERFATSKPIGDRKRICAATGTFHNLYDEKPTEFYQDYIQFFRLDTYHPVRRLLYRRSKDVTSWLDSRISLYREKSGRKDPFARLLTLLRLDVSQSEYFAFDIVDFYNNHKCAIVGEEASGSPTIGFFEAMACGCAVLGQEGSFYEGLGLEPGVHYLTHDGTLEGIWQTLEDTLETPGQIETISAAGQKYIEGHCRRAAVFDSLRQAISRL